jgi:uncharacterized cupredoxin-like copper-binding protein
MKLRSFLIVLAFIAIPLLAACGDDDNTSNGSSIQKTASAVIQQGKTAVNNGVNTVQGAATTVTGKLTAAATSGQSGTTKIAVSEKDFSISPDNTSPQHGALTFDVKNEGATAHQFVVLKTDIAEDKLPVASGTVNETATGITKIAEIPNVDPGQSQTLTTSALAPGTYVLICNLPAHYQAGMHTTLHVQ